MARIYEVDERDYRLWVDSSEVGTNYPVTIRPKTHTLWLGLDGLRVFIEQLKAAETALVAALGEAVDLNG